MEAENLAENLRKPVVVVRFAVMRGATTRYFSPALHISAGIRWETTSWIPTSQKTAGIHDPGLRITPGSDPDPGMIPGLARPLPRAKRQPALLLDILVTPFKCKGAVADLISETT